MEKEEVYNILNRAYFSDECHEKKIIQHLPSLLKSVRVFVDIGASLGQYTRLASRHIDGGYIYSIEPDPIRFEQLKKNCGKWSEESGNTIIPLNAAVSDTEGKIKFFTTNTNLSGGLFELSAENNSYHYEEIMVDSITLDVLLKNCSPDFIKIDVEGAELRVLKGATNILKSGKAMFLVELHYWGDIVTQSDTNNFFEFMKSYGYYPVWYYGKLLFVNSGTLLFRAKLLSPLLKKFFCLKAAIKSKMNSHCNTVETIDEKTSF